MLPIVITRRLVGANGRNWPCFAMLDPDAPLPAAVLAQEAWEAMHKANPLNMLRTRISARHRRAMELMGHEIEVQAAALIYGMSPARYRAREAEVLRSGYGGLFAGMGPSEIVAEMAARSAEARAWVQTRRDWLRRWK